MCRWLAYIGRPLYLEELILSPENSLIEQSMHCREGKTQLNGDGFGIGWYAERAEPGVFRDILPAWSDENLKNLVCHIKSGLFFGHVRASTGTATNRCNCHPFQAQRWLFMHNGQIGNYERHRRKLEAALSNGAYEQRLGSTDSELIFLLAMDNGLDKSPLKAIHETIAHVDKMCQGHEPFRFTACLSDGKNIYAIRHATDGFAPSMYWYQGKNGTIVASEPLDQHNPNWKKIPDETILVIKRDRHQFYSIEQLPECAA